MRIRSLRLKDFKSYAGKHEIGPFDNYVAVVGSNASGKSNCFDAICFVLGASASTMRCTSLSHLIWTGDPPAERASVKLIFENRYGETQTIKRVVTKSNTTCYINGQQKSSKEYKVFLSRIGFDSKFSSYIIFQGDVHNIAHMKPMEITRLIEKISGSIELKEAYETKENEYQFAEKIVTQNEEYKDNLLTRRLALKTQTEEARKWKEMNDDLKNAESQVKLFEQCQKFHLLKHLEKKMEMLKNEENEKTIEKANFQQSLESCYSAIDGIKERNRQIQSQYREAKREADKAKTDFKSYEVQVNNAKLNNMDKAKEIAELCDKIKNEGTRSDYLKDKTNSFTKKYRAMIDNKAEIQSIYDEILNHKSDDISQIDVDSAKDKLKTELDNQTRYQNQIEFNENRIQEISKKIKELNNIEEPQLPKEYNQIANRIQELNTSLHDDEYNLEKTKRSIYITRKQDTKYKLIKRLKKEIGAKGYVSELYEPVTLKYNQALLAGLGKNLESIVVRSPQDAIKGIEICKTERLGHETFIPLERLNLNHLTRNTDGVKPLYQIIKTDKEYEPLFQHLTKNMFYCENPTKANQLSKQGKYKKIIDVNGTVYRSNGVMTGGKMYSDDFKQLREIDDLKESIFQAKEELGILEIKLKELDNSYQEQKEKYNSIMNEKHNLENQIAKSTDSIEQLKNLNKISYENIHVLNIKINTYNTKEKELSKQQGEIIINLNNQNKKLLKDLKISTFAKLLELYPQFLEEEKEYEDMMSEFNYMDIAANENRMKELACEQKALNTTIKSLKEMLTNAKNLFTEKEKQVNEIQEQLDHEKGNLNQFNKQTKQFIRKISRIEQTISSISSKNKDFNHDYDKEKYSLFKCIKKNGIKEKDINEGLFSSLPDDLRAQKSIPEIERIKFDMNKKIQNIKDQLEKQEPNLQAQDSLDNLNIKLKEHKEMLKKQREDLKTLYNQYRIIKKERYTLFINALKIIEDNVKMIYPKLTSTAQQPLGGSAFLTIENLHYPYLGGIFYSVAPPMKRNRNIADLSGGEQTLAVVSLVFAMNKVHPSPCFIMDEIDAALDKRNVAMLSNFLINQSINQQIVVVSHKETIFSYANTLIGIARDVENQSSHPYLLPLLQILENENGGSNPQNTEEVQYDEMVNNSYIPISFSTNY